MSVATKARRSYRSPLREQRALQTRHRVLEAARRLLGGRGLHGASVAAIARAARVSEPTVYVVFGSKERLARELYAQLKAEIRLAERYEALMAEPDPRRKLALAASITRDYSERGLEVIEALRQAGPMQKALRAGWREAEAMRHRGQAAMVGQLSAHLKPGLEVSTAADIVWTLTSHELYALLVVQRRWSPQAYERWLAAELCAAILTSALE